MQACQTCARSAQVDPRVLLVRAGKLAASLRRILEKRKQWTERPWWRRAPALCRRPWCWSRAGRTSLVAGVDRPRRSGGNTGRAGRGRRAGKRATTERGRRAPPPSATRRRPPRSEPPPTEQAAPSAPAPACRPSAEPASPAATATAVADPILEEVRQQLAQPTRANADRADRAALAAFYAERSAAPLWVKTDGFTTRARHAMAEIRRAEDWGLSAAAYELPQLASNEVAAVRAGGGRDQAQPGDARVCPSRARRTPRPAQVSRSFDQKPSLPDPKEVMRAVAGTETPGTYLVGLHPKHPQFERLRQALLKAPAGGARPVPTAEPAIELPNGPTLKPGMEHPHVAFLRQRLECPGQGRCARRLRRAAGRGVMAFQRQKGIRPDGVDQSRARGQPLMAAARGRLNPHPPPTCSTSSPIWSAGAGCRRISANFMCGTTCPEFTTRVVKSGRTAASGQDHCRQARDADRDVLCQHALRRLRPGMGGP